MQELLCIGDSTLDFFIKPHEGEILRSNKNSHRDLVYEKLLCFSYGDKIEVENVTISLGGTACNVAVGTKKLGIESALMSFCGNDDFGQKIKRIIEQKGIDLVNFVTDRTIHSTYSFILRYKNDRTILVYRDNFDYAKLALHKIKNTKWLYLSSLGDGYEVKLISLASEKNIRLVLNPGKKQLNDRKRDFMRLLKFCEVLILNKEEAEILVNARFPLQIKELYYKLSDFGIKNIVITDGKNGAYARGNDRKIIYEKAISVDTVESTGAGDAFSSGFLASFIKENDIKKALRFGIINGGKSTEKVGAQNGLLTQVQLDSHYQNHYSI